MVGSVWRTRNKEKTKGEILRTGEIDETSLFSIKYQYSNLLSFFEISHVHYFV